MKKSAALTKSSAAYPIDQCGLYKLRSKRKLSSRLGLCSPSALLALANNTKYSIFSLKETTCVFSGVTVNERWIQNPSDKLKKTQARISQLLSRVVAPTWAHGAVRGLSYRSNAAAHATSVACATFDIKRFFPSTAQSRVFDFFKNELCCESDVAAILTKLTCYDGVLPTGAPTSPLLSIYANRPMFEALAALAARHQLIFTVYIDDLTFSGESIPKGLSSLVRAIIKRHGHKLSEHKTKYFSAGDVKRITGVVIREGKLQVPHARFRKARKIGIAFASSVDATERLRLANRLLGLAGEAAYLDDRFVSRKLAVKELAREARLAVANAKLI